MTASRPDTWMPLYWGDYLRDTMHLRAEGHGAYLLLIAHYWTRGAALPADNGYLMTVTRLDAKAWNRLRPLLEQFFEVSDGFWTHGRIERELARSVAITEARRVAGKRGGKATANGKANSKQVLEQTTKQNPTPSQPQSLSKKEIPPHPSGASPLKNSNGVPLPFDTMPDGWRYLALDMGHEDPDGEFQKLKDWCAFVTPKSKALKRDWKAFWRNWIRKSVDDNRKRTGGSNNSHKRGWIDAAIAVGAKIEDPPDVFG